MKSRFLLALLALAAILLVTAGAVYAYDATRQDRIAAGLKVGGISVGGLTVADARIKLRRAVLPALGAPVTARHGARRFVLDPSEAGVNVDIDGSVERALERSRSGGMVARTWRSITGDELDDDLPLRVNYSKVAVAAHVTAVKEAVDQLPVEAKVNLEGGNVEVRVSRNGRSVDAARLRRDLARALVDRAGARSVRVRTRLVRPSVQTKDLASRYPAIVIVDRSRFKLVLYKNLRPAKTYGIAVGKAGLETPAGLYHVQNKAENPAWHVPDSEWAGKLRGKVIAPDDPRNPIEARWMGIYDGAGIHGTTEEHSIGTAASHGCIRMRIPEVIELYAQVPVGAPVYIK